MKESVPTEQWMNCSFDCQFDETGAHASGCEPFQVPKVLSDQLTQSRGEELRERARRRERRAAQPDFFELSVELTELFQAELLLSHSSSTQLAGKLVGALLAEYDVKKRPAG